MLTYNKHTRIFVKNNTDLKASFQLMDNVGVDSLSLASKNEVIRGLQNGRIIVPLAVLKSSAVTWSGTISGYLGNSSIFPLDDNTMLFDILILFGSCNNPLDITSFASGYIFKDVLFNTNSVSKIRPGDMSAGVVSFSSSFTSYNGCLLPTSATKLFTGTFITALEYYNDDGGKNDLLLFDGIKSYRRTKNDSFSAEAFILNANPISLLLNNDNDIIIASDLEIVFTDIWLDKQIRIATMHTGFSSLYETKSAIYFTTNAGIFGKIDKDTFTITTINTNANGYSSIIKYDNSIIAAGNGVYYSGYNNYTLTASNMLNYKNGILFTSGVAVVITYDKFLTIELLGKTPELFSQLIVHKGYFIGLGESGKVYYSVDDGIIWAELVTDTAIVITGNYAVGTNVYAITE